MTTTYLNSVNTQTYKTEAFEYIALNMQNINLAAGVIGISAGAIAGAMAEENNNYDMGDWSRDQYAMLAIVTRYGDEEKNEFLAALEQGNDKAQEWLDSHPVPDYSSAILHGLWEDDYEAVNADDKPDALDKLLHPTLMDVGPGNFKIATAIRLVNEYSTKYPGLGLDKYLSDYGALVSDLMNDRSPVTAQLYGIYLKEHAEAWFKSSGAYGDQWDELPLSFRDALLITYSNVGETHMSNAMQALYTQRNLPYEPQPGLTLTGGMNHLRNAQSIGNSIGLPDYGVDVAGVEHMVDDALNEDDLGIASRYALYRLRYVAVTGLDYSEYNQNGQLDLFDPVTQEGEMTEAYLRDRAAFTKLVVINYLYGIEPLEGTNAIEFKDEMTGDYLTIRNDLDHVTQRFFFGDDEVDIYTGGEDHDHLYGGGGNDTLSGKAGDDYLEGNAGIDHLLGGAGNDELRGGAGDDARIHNSGLYGGEGDDALYGEAGLDTLDGGTGRDLLVGGLGQDHLMGGEEIDVLYGDNRYFDEALNRYVLVDDGVSDRLQGGAGDDLYYAGAGDVINDSDGIGSVCMNVTTGNGDQTYVLLGLNALRQTDDPNVYEEYNAFYDATIRYTYGANGTLTVTDTRNVASTITIDNFSDTNLGINIGAARNPPLWRDYDHISYWWDWFWNEANNEQYNVPWSTADNLLLDAVRLVPRFFEIDPADISDNNINLTQGTDRDDSIAGSDQNDNIDGWLGDDSLSGDAGNDYLDGGEGNDYLDGGDGLDRLFGGDGDDTLNGGDGEDRLHGGDGDDVLRASDGDVLNGDAGNDRYQYALGNGNVLITNYDNEGQDVLEFLEGISPYDIALSREERDLVLSIRDGEGVITVSSFFGYFDAGLGLYSIEFADGTIWDSTWFQAWMDQSGNGDDTLTGTEEADLLEGHAGDDELHGAAGDDILNDGNGNDWLFGDEGNDQLTSESGYDHLYGGEGDDHLISGEGLGYDELYGEEGNDTLECHQGICSGGAGDDMYIHTAGQGNIVVKNSDNIINSEYINGSGFDQFLLHGVSSSDVTIERRLTTSAFGFNYGDALVLSYSIDGEIERITFNSFFIEDGNGSSTLDRITFDDGVSWDYDFINNVVRQATDGIDNLYANIDGDTFHGLGGNDNLHGSDGSDQLYGDEGNDVLVGGRGDDTLSGGVGNDRLYGNEGSDVYLYNIGDGDDLINDSVMGGADEINTIRLGEGLTRDNIRFRPMIWRDSYAYLRDPEYSIWPGDTLIIELMDTGETLLVRDYFRDYMRPGADSYRNYPYIIELADGSPISQDEIIALCTDFTSETDYYLGNNNDNTAHLQEGDDFANGGVGNDHLFGEDGNDHLYGEEGNDELVGGQGDDTLWGGDGNNVLVGDEGNDILSGGGNNDELMGGAGDDELYGGDSDDSLNGGEGNDILSGGNGDDVYLFGYGHGQCTIDNENVSHVSSHHDVLRLLSGVEVSDVTLIREGMDLVLTLVSTGDRVTVTDNFLDGSEGRYAIDAIEFGDGTVWDAQIISDLLLQPSAGDDLVYADINGSVLDGQAGNDTLIGAQGDDHLSGGSGNDSLDGGAGNDTLLGNDGDDEILGGEGSDIILGDTGNDNLHGGEGNDRLVGGAGVDQLNGDEGDDLLATSAGTNTLRGGAGNDVYLIGAEAGENTIINRNDLNENAYDRIIFDDGIRPDMVVLSREDNDLVIECAGSVTRVERYITNINLPDNHRIDDLQFQDGTYWSHQDVLARLLEGDATDQTLFGYESNDLIDGAGGNDSINGMMGDDQLFGGSGNDHIDGDNGNDQLTGGTGDDRLEGDQGNDTYLFESGDGQDVIFDLNGNNRIEYLDLLSNQVDINRSGDDLVITDLVGGGEITVLNQFGGINSSSEIIPIEVIQFSDGIVWDAEEILNQITNGGAGDDVIEGTPETDSIDALDGNDDVFAHEGDDIVSGGTGDDYLFGETGNDLLIGGDGIDFVLGMEGDDYLDGGSGNDFLIASNTWPGYHELSDLREVFATDNYALDAWDRAYWPGATAAEYDILFGGEGDDLLIGAGELDGGSGSDRLLGSGVLYGGSGDDHLISYGVDDHDSGHHELYASSLLDGGQGNDTLEGQGNTAYRFNLGDGQDSIHNNWVNLYHAVTPQGRVIFGEGIEAASVNFERQGSDLLVRYGNQDDSVTITDWFVRVNAPGYPHHNQFFHQVDEFEFADGTVITAEQAESGLASDVGPFDDEPSDPADPVTLVGDNRSNQLWGFSGDDNLSGEGGDDDIHGASGDDRLRGGTGSDQLEGGDGNDLYLYAPGDGHDTIDNRDNDGGRDVLRFEAGISLENVTLTRNRNNLILTISGNGVFYSGTVTVLNYFQDDGDNTYALAAIEFSDGSTWDYDYVAAHLTLGTEGDDELYGNLIGDELHGLAGDDVIYGSGGDDQLTGGAGNDRLYGQEGMDSLTGSEGDDWLYGGGANDTLQAGLGSDRLVGGIGDDSLSGGAGDDQYFYSLGHGVDTIDNSGGGNDTIYFTDVTANRLSYHQDGDDLLIVVDGDLAQSIRVMNHFLGGDAEIDLIQTSEGNELSAVQLSGLLTAMPAAAPDSGGQDVPATGGDGGTTETDGATQPDTGGGTDTGSDPVDSGVTTDPVSPPQPSGDDALIGSEADETLIVGAGNDTLSGGLGNDLLLGDTGDDLYIYTGGEDTLRETAGVDTLRFDNGITFSQVASGLQMSGDDLVLQVDGGPDQITLNNFFLGGDYVVETIEFATGGSLTAEQIFGAFGLVIPAAQADFSQTLIGESTDDAALHGGDQSDLIQGYNGSDHLQGNGGDDRLEGGNGADALAGGAGNDLLIGGRGDDTYFFAAGDGQDLIDNHGGGFDTLQFSGIDFGQIASGLMRSGDDLILGVSGGSDQVTLQNFFLGGDHSVDRFSFASGGEISADQIFAAFGLSNPDPQGSPDYPGLPDERGYETVTLGDGSDNNYLASSGNDFVDGGAGDDQLQGNGGDDYLIGGYGSDLYSIGAFSGHDRINNYDAGDSGTDTLRFEEATVDDLWFSRTGDDLTITQAGSDDQVTIEQWYSDPAQEVDRIEAGGSVLLSNQVDQLVMAMASFDVPAGVGNVIPQDAVDALQPLLAESWQATA